MSTRVLVRRNSYRPALEGQHLSMRTGPKRIVSLDLLSETVKRFDPKIVAKRCRVRLCALERV